MTRTEYMNALSRLLAPLPQEERADALEYYEEYFDAAGPEKEAATMAELGTPEEVARKILEDPAFAAVPAAKAEGKKQRKSWRQLLGLADDRDSTASEDRVLETEAENLRRLRVDLACGDVCFVRSEDPAKAQVRITGDTGELEWNIHFSADGSVIEGKTRKGVHTRAPEIRVTIALPDITPELLDLDLNMGDVDLGALCVGTLKAELNMGGLKGSTLRADRVDAHLNMGGLKFDAISTKELKAELNMGSFAVGLVSCASDVNVSNNMGSIRLTVDGAEADWSVDADISKLGSLTVGSHTCRGTYAANRGARHIHLENNMGATNLQFQG